MVKTSDALSPAIAGEADRPMMATTAAGHDVQHVITTVELAQMLADRNIDLRVRARACLWKGFPCVGTSGAVLAKHFVPWRTSKCSCCSAQELPEDEFDAPLGLGTGGGQLFGTTGGVMEAALRTVVELISGQPMGRVLFEVRSAQCFSTRPIP